MTLGVAGYLLKGIPWAALPILFFLGWMIVRTAQVFREELGRAVRRRVPLTPWVTALVVAMMWQLPALAFVPAWAPAPAIRLWQGALLPIPGLVEMFNGRGLPVEPLLWLMLPLEMALFVWVAARNLVPVRRSAPHSGGALPSAAATGRTGEWAPARRARPRSRHDVNLDVEPEAEAESKE